MELQTGVLNKFAVTLDWSECYGCQLGCNFPEKEYLLFSGEYQIYFIVCEENISKFTSASATLRERICSFESRTRTRQCTDPCTP